MTKRNKRLFLDLEGTVIDLWESGELGNIIEIKELISRLDISEIGIFSFAIYNEEDRRKFNSVYRAVLEKELSVKINHVPTLEEIQKETMKSKGIYLELFEFSSLLGKEIAFELYCNKKFKDTDCFLVDDMVSNKEINNLDNGNNYKFYNIDTLILEHSKKNKIRIK